jgi:integrase
LIALKPSVKRCTLLRPIPYRGYCAHEASAQELPKLRRYAVALGLKIGSPALRATAATNAPDHDADIAKVQEWLGHANVATTPIYDRHKMKPEDSPTYKVSY